MGEAKMPRGGSQPSDTSEGLQGSPETMSKFLKVVEKLSETKEKETGNGRLEMTELMAALNTFQTSDNNLTSAVNKHTTAVNKGNSAVNVVNSAVNKGNSTSAFNSHPIAFNKHPSSDNK